MRIIVNIFKILFYSMYTTMWGLLIPSAAIAFTLKVFNEPNLSTHHLYLIPIGLLCAHSIKLSVSGIEDLLNSVDSLIKNK